MHIGENIQKYRKKCGLTQKKLAELCGVATGTIQQYELGKREPNFVTLVTIASNLGIHVTQLFGISNLSPDEQFNIMADKVDSDAEFNHAWDNFLITNNIHFMSLEKDGIVGMLLTFTDTNESYFLTKEQAEQLPTLSIEQIKLLIKAMGKNNN